MHQATRQAKEDFVTGHNGSSAPQVVYTLAVAPILAWLVCLLHALLAPSLPSALAQIVELGLAAPVLVLAFTLDDNGALARLYGALLVFACLCLLLCVVLRRPLLRASASAVSHVVSQFRATLALGTVLAILAVDFRLFPRFHAKTDTYGVSLMDLGTGCFVFAKGLVQDRRRPGGPGLAWELGPLLALGMGRIAVHSMLGYPHVVSEYGVHWNFFLSLALVAGVARALRLASFGSAWLHVGAAVLALVVYESALRAADLAAFVFSAPRDGSLFGDNREGLLSLYGYVALLLLGAACGRALFGERASLVDVTLNAGLFCALSLAALFVGEFTISRRLANAGYVLWVVTLCAGTLVVLLVGHAALARALGVQPVAPRAGDLCDVLSRQTLALFLLGNLSTGLVNLTMDTLSASSATAAGVLVAHLLVVGGAALALAQREPSRSIE